MKRLTKEQAVIISAYTGILHGPVMSELHEYIETKLGRPVMTHEIPSVLEQVKNLATKDFLDICYKEPNQ